MPMGLVAGEDCSGIVDASGKLFVWGDGYPGGVSPPFQGPLKQVMTKEIFSLTIILSKVPSAFLPSFFFAAQVLLGAKDILAINMSGTLMRYADGCVSVLQPSHRFLQIGRGMSACHLLYLILPFV